MTESTRDVGKGCVVMGYTSDVFMGYVVMDNTSEITMGYARDIATLTH